MPVYRYTAHASAGAGQGGTIEAGSRREALRRLIARGVQVRSIDEQGAIGVTLASTKSPQGKPVRLSRKVRLPFLEALKELIGAGMSAGEAIRLLASRVQEPQLKSLCAALWARLGEGDTLSQAVKAFPAIFDEQTASLIEAGEATGNLLEVLDRLVDHFTEQRLIRQKLASALAYPVFICVLGFGVVLFLLVYLMPRLQSLLASLGGELPFATRLLMTVSHGVLTGGPFGLGLIVVAALAFARWRNTAAGRTRSDEWLVRLPVVRNYTQQKALLDFSHTLAVLLESGINTIEALRLTERAVANTAVQQRLRAATNRVIEGTSLSKALVFTGIVPPMMLDRLAVGEQTGNVSSSLRKIAESVHADLTRRLNQLTRLVSGIMLFGTFGFVAFLAYAIVSALFQVSSSFRL